MSEDYLTTLMREHKELKSALQSAREERNIIVTNLSFLLGGLGLADKAPSMTGIYEDEFFSLGESVIKERDTIKAEAAKMREERDEAIAERDNTERAWVRLEEQLRVEAGNHGRERDTLKAEAARMRESIKQYIPAMLRAGYHMAGVDCPNGESRELWQRAAHDVEDFILRPPITSPAAPEKAETCRWTWRLFENVTPGVSLCGYEMSCKPGYAKIIPRGTRPTLCDNCGKPIAEGGER